MHFTNGTINDALSIPELEFLKHQLIKERNAVRQCFHKLIIAQPKQI